MAADVATAKEEMSKQQKLQMASLINSFEDLARYIETKRQALSQVLSKKFENERAQFEEKASKMLTKSERDMVQVDQAITQIKTAIQANSHVSLLSDYYENFQKSMHGTKDLIGNIHLVLKERGQLERNVLAIRHDLANKVIKTINTESVQRFVRIIIIIIQIEKLDFSDMAR